MKLEEFEIGKPFFYLAGQQFLCTDIGTRAVFGIPFPHEEFQPLEIKTQEFWMKGPPYMVEEEAFNERKMEQCYLSIADFLKERMKNKPTAYKNSFSSKETSEFMGEIKNSQFYRNNPYRVELMKHMRTSNNETLYPYGFNKNDNPEFDEILFLNMHNRKFDKMLISDWIKLPLET